MLKIKESDLNKLLDEVSEELSSALNSEKLSKSEKELKKDDGSLKQPEESEGPPSAGPEASASPSPEASDSVEPSASAGPDASAAPGGDPAAEAGPEMSVEALMAEYSKLPPDELQMHLQAAQMAAQQLGMGQSPAGDMGSPSAGAGAPPAGPPMPPPEATQAPQPPPAMKSEKNVEAKLSKSEEAHKAEIASLKEDVEILAKTVKSLIEVPIRKAITSIDQLPEEEVDVKEHQPLSTQDFWGKLKEVSKRSDLKKSDKQLILDIYEKRVTPDVAAKRLVKLFAEE